VRRFHIAVQQGLTLVPISAQLELTFPISDQFVPDTTRINPSMCPGHAEVELHRERCVPKFLKLSSEESECKPLPSSPTTTHASAPATPFRAPRSSDASGFSSTTAFSRRLTLVQLNLFAVYGIRGARRGCIARVEGVLGGVESG